MHCCLHARLPPLHSMLITGTGFFGADRTEIKALTDQLGAQYSGELVRGATTVLIVPDSWLSEGELSEKCRKVHAQAIHHGATAPNTTVTL